MNRAVMGGLLCIAAVTAGSCVRQRSAAVTAAATAAVTTAAACGKPSGPPSHLRIVPGKSTAEVRGVVVLSETGEPVVQAALWIDSVAGKPVATGADGRFSFSTRSVGRHQIVMRRVGVRGLRDTIDVPVAGELRIEAAIPALDTVCGEFGSVYVKKPK